MCATLCSFCKKSASKLVPHYLCDCCLVHLECCEATQENRWASLAKTIVPDEDTNERVACEICLEQYPEDELDEHKELCTARLVFRCFVCDGDYVNKEGLWNHLDQHEIADESKELHYQEIRATYKVHKCVLCNDQRGYQETVYWRHIHEDHDGFFLRCLDCGTNFRSEKRKADHVSNHCNVRRQTETSSTTALELVLVASGSCEQKSLTLPGVSDFHKNSDDLTNTDQKNGESQFSAEPSAGNCDGNIVENEFKIKSETSQANLGKSSVISFDITCSYCDKKFNDEIMLTRHIGYCHRPVTCDICGKTAENKNQIRYHKLMSHTEPSFKCSACPKGFHFYSLYRRHLSKHEREGKVPCPLCGSKFKRMYGLSIHMKRFHQSASKPTSNLSADCSEQEQENGKEQLGDNTRLKMETSEKHISIDGASRCDKPSQVDTTIYQLSEESTFIIKKEQPFDSLEMSQYRQETSETDISIDGTSRCDKPLDTTIHQPSEGSTFLIKEEQPFDSLKVIQNRQDPPDEIRNVDLQVTNDNNDNKCTYCAKECRDQKDLRRHYRFHHRPTECKLCMKTFMGVASYHYHKVQIHTEPRYKCPHCQKLFHRKIGYRRHLVVHQHKRETPCNLCGRKFKNLDHLNFHKKRMHTMKKVVVQKSLTCCPLCGDNFEDEHLLRKHVGTIHKMVICTICGITFPSTRQLKKHKIHWKHTDAISLYDTRKEELHGHVVQPSSTDSSPGIGSGIMDDSRGENHIGKPKDAAAHIATIGGKIQRWIVTKKLRMPSSHIEVYLTGYRRATVKCWYCSRPITLSSRTNQNGSWSWIISNITQHVLAHLKALPNRTIERESSANLDADMSDRTIHGQENILLEGLDNDPEIQNAIHCNYEDYSSQKQTIDKSEDDLQESSVTKSVKTEFSTECL